MANGFQPRSGILNPVNVFGFAEMGRSAAVQGMSDALTLQRQQMENEQLLPLQIEAARLQNEDRAWSLETLNPLRADNMRLGNRLQRQQAGLNVYKERVAQMEMERLQRLENSILDEWSDIWTITPPLSEPQLDKDAAEKFWEQRGEFLLNSSEPFFQSMGQKLRGALGKPHQFPASSLLGQVEDAVLSGDTGKLRSLKRAIAFSPHIEENQRIKAIEVLDEEIMLHGGTANVPGALLTEKEFFENRAKLEALKLRRNQASHRQSQISEGNATEAQKARLAEEIRTTDQSIRELEFLLGEREANPANVNIDRLSPFLPASDRKQQAKENGDGATILMMAKSRLSALVAQRDEAESRFIDSGGKNQAAKEESDRLSAEILELQSALGEHAPSASGALLPPKDQSTPTSDYYRGLENSPFVSPSGMP